MARRDEQSSAARDRDADSQAPAARQADPVSRGDAGAQGEAAGRDASSRAGSGPARPATPITQQIGRLVLVVLLALFAVFAAVNAQPVDFSWVFGETRVTETADGTAGGVPLILLLLASFALGAVIALGGARTARHRRRATRGKDEQDEE